MRRIAIALVAVVGLVVVLLGGMRLSWELGEGVVGRAQDDDGAFHDTRLWVVDVDGAAYVRTGNPQSPWLLRVRAHPDVEVTRAGATASFRAVPVEDPGIRDRVNAAVAEKYGFSETTLRATFLTPERVTPVRLDPR
jgi:hypothetical protein